MYPTPYDDPVASLNIHPLDYAKKHYSRAIEPLLLKQDGRYEIMDIKGGDNVQDIVVKVKSKRDVYDTRPLSEISNKDLRIRDIRYHRFTVQEVLNSKYPNGLVSIPDSEQAMLSSLASKLVIPPEDDIEITLTENSVSINCPNPNSLFWTGSGTLYLGTPGGDTSGPLWNELFNFTELPDGVLPNAEQPPISGLVAAFATTNPTVIGFKYELDKWVIPSDVQFSETMYIAYHDGDQTTAMQKFLGIITQQDPDFTFFFDVGILQIANVIGNGTRALVVQGQFTSNLNYYYSYNSDDPTPKALYVTLENGQLKYRVTVMIDGVETTAMETATAYNGVISEFAVSLILPNGATQGDLKPIYLSAIGG